MNTDEHEFCFDPVWRVSRFKSLFIVSLLQQLNV